MNRRDLTRRALFGGGVAMGALWSSPTKATAAGTDFATMSDLATKVDKGSLLVNVRDYGARGDGSTDDTAAINSALVAGAGRTVFVPAGTYMVNATAGTGAGGRPVGVKLNQASTRLLLDPKAVLSCVTNSSASYSVLQVTAADCVVEGGTIKGDLATHTGTTGEWGHCVDVNAGAHRFRLSGTQVREGWGDGVAVYGGPTDVRLVDVVSDSNRRNGASIVAAARLSILGGRYVNAGSIKATAPNAGICLEPNPSSGGNVTDFTVTGVTVAGNRGAGLQIVQATAQTTSGTVTAVRSISNWQGVHLCGTGGAMAVTLTGVEAASNASDGFMVDATVSTGAFTGCTARCNTVHGFNLNGKQQSLNGCEASLNGRSGFIVTSTAVGTNVTGGASRANSQSANAMYPQIDVYGKSITITGHVSDAGDNAAKPATAYYVRTGASGVRILGCAALGAFTSAYLDRGIATAAFPIPGVGKQSLARPATDATTTQALANSLRLALINLGYGT